MNWNLPNPRIIHPRIHRLAKLTLSLHKQGLGGALCMLLNFTHAPMQPEAFHGPDGTSIIKYTYISQNGPAGGWA